MRENRPVSFWMLLVLLIAVIGLLIGGIRFYTLQKNLLQQAAIEQLHSIGKLKVSQIDYWRLERLADARVLQKNFFLNENLEQLIYNPSDFPDSKIRIFFKSLQENYKYSDILLVNAQGECLFTANGGKHIYSEFKEALEQSFKRQEPVFNELHFGGYKPKPQLSLAIPVFSKNENKKLGAIILVCDASEFLFPKIQSWPTPSKTAETLLFRREGDQVLFLNELRHASGTALKKRIPLTEKEVPAVKAIAGQEGTVFGKDYRGVDVVAVILPVPGTPWFVIAKQDVIEIFAQGHAQGAMTLALLFTLLAILIFIGISAWQRQQKNHYHSLFIAESRQRAAMEMHSVTLKAIGDAVIATDETGKIDLLNPVAEELSGWSVQDAVGRPLAEVFKIVNETTREVAADPAEQVLQSGQAIDMANHTLLIAKDGKEIPIADSAAPIFDQQKRIIGVVIVFRDQTKEFFSKKLVEIRLALIEFARENNTSALLTRTLDEVGKLVDSPIAFYHFVDADQNELTLQQWSTDTLKEFCHAEGEGLHYSLDKAGVWADAVRERKPVVHNDYESLPAKKGMPDGHAKVIRELVVPVLVGGKVVAVLGVGNKSEDYTQREVEALDYLANVTWSIIEQQRSREALADAEKRFFELFANMTSGISVFKGIDDGKDFIFVDVNSAATKLLQVEKHDLIGRKLTEALPGCREMGLLSLLREVLQTGNARHLCPKHYKDAKLDRWYENRVFKLPDGEVVAQFDDVTNIKAKEQELEHFHYLLSYIIEHSPYAIAVFDQELKFIYVSKKFLAEYNVVGQQVIGRQIYDVFPDLPENWREAHQNALKGEIVEDDDDSFVRPDGMMLRTRWECRPWYKMDESIGGIIVYTENINERKEKEAEQKKLESQLIQSQKMESVGRLAGGVAHDFNNMLSVIIGYAELAIDSLDQSSDLYKDLTEIMNAAQRSSEITNKLLAFARKQTIAPQVIDLNVAVEGMLRMLRRLIGEDIDLLWKPCKNLWAIKADRSQIDQILANLCVNARDAIAGVGKMTIETGNKVFDEEYCAINTGFVAGEYVMLAVSDDGCGMGKEALTNLFEPFYTTKSLGKGTGLGLATVYGIVKQNNGFINVYSELEKGTTFKIYLPRNRGEVETKSKTSENTIPQGQGQVILIVEDETAILKMTQSMLESLGYKTLAASSPILALALAQSEEKRIDLLLTDVVMPDMNGRDLANHLKESYADLKVLFMSGYTADVIAHKGILEDGFAFIQKPFSKKDISIKVNEILTES